MENRKDGRAQHARQRGLSSNISNQMAFGPDRNKRFWTIAGEREPEDQELQGSELQNEWPGHFHASGKSTRPAKSQPTPMFALDLAFAS